MDLHFTSDSPTDAEREAIDSLLGVPDSHWTGGGRDDADDLRTSEAGHRTRGKRHLLLPALHAINDRCGWISRGALNYCCRRLGVPPAEAYGVASFYDLFSMDPQAPVVVRVCDDIACRATGFERVREDLRSARIPEAGQSDGSGVVWTRSPCLGLCERAPATLITAAGAQPWHAVSAPSSAGDIKRSCQRGEPAAPRETNARASVPQAGQRGLSLLRRVGEPSGQDLDSYRKSGGFAAMDLAIRRGTSWILDQVQASNLVGRGGAAFPTGIKWRAVAAASGPKYVVCNADESEPGTFKDRVLMEGDPYAIVEAIAIAALATNCDRAFVYVRGEYPDATQRLGRAIEDCEAAGLLDQACPIEIRRGAGAYICGEETALFNSIEGYRGEPRNKPPYPTESGLFQRPTLVNNVETLANIPLILLRGGERFSRIGTQRSSGPKLFCLSGHVRRPGVYECEFGARVRDLIDMAGGMGGSGRLQAVLVGGAAGAFLHPDEIDTRFTFEDMRTIGATVGSAVVMPFDDTVDLGAMLVRIAEFFRHESCGQCVPCRVGTVRQHELLKRLHSGQVRLGSDRHRRLLAEISQVMRDASICGLGHTAASAVDSALQRFPIFQERAR